MKNVFNIWLLMISATIGVASYTFLLPVNIIYLNSLGYSATKIGIFIAIPSLLVFLISPQLARLLDRYGGKKLLYLSKIIICLAIPFFAISDDFIIFCLINFVIGICAAFLWPFTDSYIAKYSPQDKKGHYTGIYQMLIGLAYTIGPLIPAIYKFAYIEAIITVFIISVVSIIPIFFMKFEIEFGKRDVSKHKIFKLIKYAPFLMLIALIGGLFEVGTISMGTLHSINLGLTASQATYIVSAIGFGSFIFQYPIGKLADKFDINRLLTLFIVIIFISSCAIFFVQSYHGLIFIGILWGAFGGGLYTISIVAISKKYSGRSIDILTSLMVTIYTLGSLSAPTIAGFLIDIKGTMGLPIFLTAISFGLLISTIARGK